MFPVAPDPDNKPAPAAVRHLGPDDDWTLATELGPAAKIFQQDSINLPHVQTGLKAQEQQEVDLRQLQRDEDPPLLGEHVPVAGDRRDERVGDATRAMSGD